MTYFQNMEQPTLAATQVVKKVSLEEIKRLISSDCLMQAQVAQIQMVFQEMSGMGRGGNFAFHVYCLYDMLKSLIPSTERGEIFIDIHDIEKAVELDGALRGGISDETFHFNTTGPEGYTYQAAFDDPDTWLAKLEVAQDELEAARLALERAEEQVTLAIHSLGTMNRNFNVEESVVARNAAQQEVDSKRIMEGHIINQLKVARAEAEAKRLKMDMEKSDRMVDSDDDCSSDEESEADNNKNNADADSDADSE